MCGINGILLTDHSFGFEHLDFKLQRMNDALKHRGPDDEGVFVETSGLGYSLGIGHRRLAIIDLQNGHQPMFSKDRQKVIVYNGEVYNFKNLKSDFLSNEEFQTQTDTEVVLKLYEKLGVDSFSLLEGMFAFSIYDSQKHKVYLVRDFFGEKPLYYAKRTNGIYWSSELKSIIEALGTQPNINIEGLNLFFRLTYIPAPYTIYDGINKLEANTYIEIDCVSGDYKINRIQIKETEKRKISFDEAVSETRLRVQQSVKSRLVSDVPVGALLSGGVDSSIVSLCASKYLSNPLDTFSVGFEKKDFDETDKSRLVAKIIGSNHHELNVGEKELFSIIDKILINFDEPYADSSALPSFVVSQYTSQFSKVVLTGDGGDEVFGGYNKYYMGKFNRIYTKWVPQSLHKGLANFSSKFLFQSEDVRGLKFRLQRLIKGIEYDEDFYFNIISLGFMEDEARLLIQSDSYLKDPLIPYKKLISGKSSLHDFREIDRLLSLEGDMVVKVDRTAMLASVETRAPLLNREIWEFTSQLPERFLLKGLSKKHILKKAFEKDFPKGFLDKPKKGFGVPVGDWLRGSLRNELEAFVNTDFLNKQGLFNANYIIPLVHNHLNGKIDNTFRVWTYYCFQKWYHQVYEKS